MFYAKTKDCKSIITEVIMPSENPTFKEKTFVTAGRLQYQKAHWHLIRAFSKIVKDIPEAQLVIFGEGELKDMLMDLIKAYKMEGNVFLNGWM